QMQLNDPGFQKFVSSTGFDPRYDLSEMIAATSATGGGPNTGLLAGKGSFQVSQITGAAITQGGKVTTYRGINLISGPEPNSPVVAFLDANTALIGDTGSVQAAIDRKLSGTKYYGPLAQKAQAASLSNQVWFATVTPLSEFLSGRVDNPSLNNLAQNNLL